MSGDYSRWSFDPRRHFAAVLMQQGRVLTDADWNEWVTTIVRRAQAGTLDALGQAVVPRETPNGFLIDATGGTLTIGAGRMYVDGLLAENDGQPPAAWDAHLAELHGTQAVPYVQQPYFPDPPELPTGGPHLVYLKVWQREVTFIEDPRLVEQALGVDTTTRLQTAWQVRVLPDVGAGVTCATPIEDIPGFLAAEPPAAGRLTTGTADVPGEPDPCLVPPSGEYKGENQLYRVEIHRGGDLAGADRATFKWSRDNGTVASRVTHIPSLDRIVVESVGRDALLRFSDGDWIEITDDWLELAGLPGEMRRIRSGGGVDDATRTILLETSLPPGRFPVDAQGRTTPARNTRVRRWDQRGRVLDENGGLVADLDAPGADGTIPIPSSGTAVLLEHGVVVTFDLPPASDRFRTGDYWTFAARTADASVEILDGALPRGIHYHYAKLALVTFPENETDCRTLWPPETGHAGCDCSVCVTPESHESGALTIQAAIDRVKQTGGTVCLGAGTYSLREPLRIVDARSLRVRGQGWATVLVAAAGGEAIEASASIGVTIEHLAVVGATPESAPSMVSLRNLFGVRVQDCFVVNLSLGDGRATAIGLDGYIIAGAIERCVLAAHTGVAGGRREDSYVLTAGLGIVDNWLWCTHRGVELARLCVHLAETRIAGNTAWGCREAALLFGGGAGAAGGGEGDGNFCNVDGTGIILGVDAARISENDVRRLGERAGDGIVLMRGLDPTGLDHCQILGNRIRGVRGHGIAIRTRVNSGMIKHNVIAETGAAGIVMEGDGEAIELVVENNQLLDVAMAANIGGAHPAAMRFVGVRELDVSSNAVHAFAREAQQAASRAAISAVASGSTRMRANRLTGIAPPAGFIGFTAALEVVPPFRTAVIADNAARRPSGDDDKLASGAWIGIHIRGATDDVTEENRRGLIALGNLAVAIAAERTFVFTATNAFAVAAAAPGEVVARGNDVTAEASDAPPVVVALADGCHFSENRIVAQGGRGVPSLIRCARAIVANNDLRGLDERIEVLRLDVVGRGQAAVLGNVCTGPILVNGAPLGQPWAALNPIG